MSGLLHYPRGAIFGDYARGGLGLAATLLPLLLVDLAVWVAVIFALLALLFAVFLLRAVERHRTEVALDDSGISLAGLWPRSIAWERVSRLRLAYYSTRRDRQRGWMNLRVGDGRQTIALESTLEGFDPLVERAAAAALANGVELDATTLANLDAMGIDASAEDAETDAQAAPAGKADWVSLLKADRKGGAG